MSNTIVHKDSRPDRKGNKLRAVGLVLACVYAGSVLYVGNRLSDCFARYDAAWQTASDKVDDKYRTSSAGNFAMGHFNNCRAVTRSGGGFRMPAQYHQKSESECRSATYLAAQQQGEPFAQDVKLALAKRSKELVVVPDSDVYLLEIERLKRILDFLMLRW